MAEGSVSIGRLMAVVALAAVNLAVLRRMELSIVGAYWLMLGVLDYLIIWKGILRRPLRAFHYTLFIVSWVGSIMLAVQVAMERLHLLGPFVRWRRQTTGDLRPTAAWAEFLRVGEFGAASLLGLLIALAAGLLASWLERNKGWDIAAFWRGALVGFVVLGLIQTALRVLDPSGLGDPGVVARYGLLAAFVVSGGLIGLARLKTGFDAAGAACPRSS